MIKLEAIFEEHSRTLEPHKESMQDQQQQHSLCSHSLPSSSSVAAATLGHYSSHSHNNNNSTGVPNSMLPDLTSTCKMQANSHKDVQDLKF